MSSGDDGISEDNALYDDVQSAKNDPNSTYNQPEQGQFATDEARERYQESKETDESTSKSSSNRSESSRAGSDSTSRTNVANESGSSNSNNRSTGGNSNVVGGREVSQETIRDVQTEALGSLNEQTGGEGQAFSTDDINVKTVQRNGRTVVTAELTDRGAEKFGEERRRIAEENLSEQAQARNEAVSEVAKNTSLSREEAENLVVKDDRLSQTKTSENISKDEAADLSNVQNPTSGRQTPVKSTQYDTQGESLVEEGRQQRDPETGEAFGGRGKIEKQLREGAQNVRENEIQRLSNAAGDFAASPAGAVGTAAANPAETLSNVRKVAQSGDISELAPRDARTRRKQAQGVAEGAAGLANVPAWAVAAIEGGEVARAGVDSVTGRGDRNVQEFGNDLSAAGAVAAADTANAARENPDQFAGQLVGAAAASGGLSAARRQLTSARRAGRIEGRGGTSSSPSSELGGRGTGSLYDTDSVDDAMGVSGPSRRSRFEGAVNRSPTAQRIRDQIDEFIGDEAAQLRDPRFRRDNDLDDTDPNRPPDAGGSFEDVRQDSLTQTQDFLGDQRRTELEAENRDINDQVSRGSRTRPQSERVTRGGQRRRRRSQEPDVRVDDDLAVGSGSSQSLATTAATTSALAAQLVQQERGRLAEAQQPTVGPDEATQPSQGLGPGLDVGPGEVQGPDDTTVPGQRNRQGPGQTPNQTTTTTTRTPGRTPPPDNPDLAPPPNEPNRKPPGNPLTPSRRPRPPDREPENTQAANQGQSSGEFGFMFGGDGTAQAGWYNEFTAALAGADRSASSSVEQQAEESLADFGTFSVASEGSEDFEAAAGFLSGEGIGVEGFGGGDDGLL